MSRKIIYLLLILCIASGCSKKIYFEGYSKHQILYVNKIPNVFYIKSTGKPITIDSITNATITKTNDTTYIIETDNLRFSTLIIRSGNQRKTINFNKLLPEVELTFRAFNYYKTNKMPKSEIRKFSSFSWTIADFPYDIMGKRTTADVLKIDRFNNSKSYTMASDSRYNCMDYAEVGDKFIFYNILAETDYGILPGKNLILEIVE